ncbi:MAG: hypothetical protein R3222_10625 [Balneolaceae bacterium]|nr:hypothetical protein [Balneolaceae bacterium]
MKRLNFTLDQDTVHLLEDLAKKFYEGNKSQTVRAALESLAAHTGHQGWVITGYTPKKVEGQVNCHGCGETHADGEILYRPVFERGNSPSALPKIPSENWLDCPDCAEKQFTA